MLVAIGLAFAFAFASAVFYTLGKAWVPAIAMFMAAISVAIIGYLEYIRAAALLSITIFAMFWLCWGVAMYYYHYRLG